MKREKKRFKSWSNTTVNTGVSKVGMDQLYTRTLLKAPLGSSWLDEQTVDKWQGIPDDRCPPRIVARRRAQAARDLWKLDVFDRFEELYQITLHEEINGITIRLNFSGHLFFFTEENKKNNTLRRSIVYTSRQRAYQVYSWWKSNNDNGTNYTAIVWDDTRSLLPPCPD